MLNKTNQFNFTTTRYTDTTFKNYLKNNKVLSFVLRLKDKFGDHGIWVRYNNQNIKRMHYR